MSSFRFDVNFLCVLTVTKKAMVQKSEVKHDTLNAVGNRAAYRMLCTEWISGLNNCYCTVLANPHHTE